MRAGIGRDGAPKEETERTDLAETEAMECVREWIGPKVCVLGVGEAGTARGKALIVAVIRAKGSEREVEEEAEERDIFDARREREAEMSMRVSRSSMGEGPGSGGNGVDGGRDGGGFEVGRGLVGMWEGGAGKDSRRKGTDTFDLPGAAVENNIVLDGSGQREVGSSVEGERAWVPVDKVCASGPPSSGVECRPEATATTGVGGVVRTVGLSDACSSTSTARMKSKSCASGSPRDSPGRSLIYVTLYINHLSRGNKPTYSPALSSILFNVRVRVHATTLATGRMWHVVCGASHGVQIGALIGDLQRASELCVAGPCAQLRPHPHAPSSHRFRSVPGWGNSGGPCLGLNLKCKSSPILLVL